MVFDGAFDTVAMGGVVFHAASGLNAIAIAQVQDSVRRGLLPDDVAQAMAQWAHSGAFSVDASVRIAVSDGAGCERRDFRPCSDLRRHLSQRRRGSIGISL